MKLTLLAGAYILQNIEDQFKFQSVSQFFSLSPEEVTS